MEAVAERQSEFLSASEVRDFIVVPRAGLEPALLAEPDFESTPEMSPSAA